MTTQALYSSFRFSLAINFGETVIGDVPADAAAWVAAEGTDVFRFKPDEAGIDYITGFAAVANEDMQPRLFEVDVPHQGLPTADGGQMVTRLWSTGAGYTDDTQVNGGAPTVMGRMLEHALGASALGHHTTVAAVGGPTSITLASASNLEAGYIIWIAKPSAPTKPYPAQVLTSDGLGAITIDRTLAPDLTIEVGDVVYGSEMSWPNPAAMVNPLDPAYSTISMLYAMGEDELGDGHVWMVGGAHLALGEWALERGQQPKITWPILAARGYPQGDPLTPTIPQFTGPIEGTNLDVPAIGRGTRVRLVDYESTDNNCTSAFSASFDPGVPVVAEDGVTECDEGAPGRISYRTEPGDTMLTLTVALTDEQQERWQGTAENWRPRLLSCTYWQQAPVGHAWCLHMRKCFLMQPPTPVTDGVNKWELVIQATADAAQSTEALAAKFIIARA